jgi:RNA polymerase sigma factor for flagellar operon FliA
MSESFGAERFACAYYHDRSQGHRDQVVFASEPIIRSIISKTRLPGDDFARPEELFQVGVIAVLQALDQFDPHTGVRFVTFAYPRIRGEIIDYLRRLDPLPRRRRVKVAKARHAFDQMAQSMGSDPTETMVAEAMGVGIEEYRTIEGDSVRRQMAYLFDERGEEWGMCLVDTMPDENADDPFRNMEWSDIRTYLDALSFCLTERERSIVELNYGEDLTLAEIGMLLGISEARVSQLRKGILSKLGRRIESTLRTAA